VKRSSKFARALLSRRFGESLPALIAHQDRRRIAFSFYFSFRGADRAVPRSLSPHAAGGLQGVTGHGSPTKRTFWQIFSGEPFLRKNLSHPFPADSSHQPADLHVGIFGMSPGKPDHYLAVYSRRLAASKSTHRAHSLRVAYQNRELPPDYFSFFDRLYGPGSNALSGTGFFAPPAACTISYMRLSEAMSCGSRLAMYAPSHCEA
jgi:hypothetical protein